MGPAFGIAAPTSLTALAGRWAPLVVFASAALVAPTMIAMPRWVMMWTLAGAIYLGCKWLAWSAGPRATRAHHLAFLFAWLGMDVVAFTARDRFVPPPKTREWLHAAGNVVTGVALVWMVVRASAPAGHLVQGWVGMVGIVLILHFGLFHLVSCAWRGAGVDARPLMDRPWAAPTLGDFWGRRWNTAFRDLTHRFVFSPLASRWGPRLGFAGGFLLSGLVHDLVISVPARAGYGLPTIYFLIQGAGALLERSIFGRRLGFGRGVVGRVWTLLIVLAPVGLLFHPPFIEVVIIPFLDALGAR